jgi:hypothetical protein
MAIASLGIAGLGLIRFVIDLGDYLEASGATNLNYRGLGVVLSGIILFAVFLFLSLWKKA